MMNDLRDQSVLLTRALQSPAHIAVRRRVIRQLVESLLYEGALSPSIVSYDATQQHFTIQGHDTEGQAVYYTCRGLRMKTFDRIRLDDRTLQRRSAQIEQEVEDVALFLYELREGLRADTSLVAAFVQELEQTILNDTLAQYQVQEQRLAGENEGIYDPAERAALDGHPYHPSYKSRIGFDVADNLAFGPDFAGVVYPCWLAIERTLLQIGVTELQDATALLRKDLGESVFASFQQQLMDRDCASEAYLFLPVHPWQWRKKIQPLFQAQLRDQRIIFLGIASDKYYPQQSIRTLANSSKPVGYSLKLALSITNTSTGRVLAPHTVHNASLISDWLSTLVERDAYLRDELECVLLREVMGVSCVVPERSPLSAPASYGVLGCIWRESLHAFLKPEEDAIPFQSLIHRDREGRPVVDRWIQQQGLEPWLETLMQTCIPPLIHLLYAHGVALESHAQNMILIHRQGVPCRMAFKDFHDGIRFSRQLLTEPELCPVLVATPEAHARINRNSFVETDDSLLVRDFVLDAFFFINLGELALFLHQHYGLAEERFWSIVVRVIERYQARFDQLQERFALFDLFAPEISVEQLTTRRLLPDSELRLHQVPNALARFRAREE